MKISFKNILLNNRQGQTLVEFAIILPLLMLLLFGIIEFGRYLYLKNSVTNAAREGARKAVVTNPWNDSTVKQYLVDNSAISLNVGNIDITPSSPSQGTAVTVTVEIPFTSVVPDLIPQFVNLNSISASATMRYE